MENLPGTLQGAQQGAARGPGAPQRRIELRHASVHVDVTGLRRSAEFTDGTVKTVAMKWSEIRRIAAFQRDAMTAAVLCVAVTDAANVVILDEKMEGWNELIAALPARVQGVPAAAEWRSSIVEPPASANWTVLFRARPESEKYGEE